MKKEIYFIRISLENETLLILCHLDIVEYLLIQEFLRSGNRFDLSLIKTHNLGLFQNQNPQLIIPFESSEIKVTENVTFVTGFNPLETFSEEVKRELSSSGIFSIKHDEDAD